jgi:hypothetical protein
MTIDYAKEFEHFDSLEFDNEEEEREHILNILLTEMSLIVDRSLHWIDIQRRIRRTIADLPEDELNSFLTCGLVIKLTERLRTRYGSHLLASYLKQRMGLT